MDKYTSRATRLIILLLALSVVFFVSGLYSFNFIEDALIQEKVIEYERHLKIITDRIDFNEELGVTISENKQEEKLVNTMETLDENSMVFAGVYRYTGHEFTLVSRRTPSYDGSYFNPLAYSSFQNQVISSFDDRSSSNTVELWHEDENISGKLMYVSYRWTPQVHNEVSYLLVTGISKDTLAMDVPPQIYWISTIRLVVMAIIDLLVLCQINNIIRFKTESAFSVKYIGKEK